MIGELIATLAADLEAPSWTAEELPALAAQVLSDRAPHEQLSASEILAWAAATELPIQRDPDNGFGQPPITAWDAGRFYIDFLFWFEGTTTIHEHSFRGAFSVVHGSSIHTTHAFELERELEDGFRLGTLEQRSVELLELGSVRAIHPGSELIHSLFHLDQPSVSLVIRSPGEQVLRPQRDYRWPGIAFDPLKAVPRQHDALVALMRVDPDTFHEAVHTYLRTASATDAYRLLEAVAISGAPRSRLEALVAKVAAFEGAGSEGRAKVSSALVRLQRQRNITARRADVVDPDHRFLLATLMLLDTRADVLAVIRSRYPTQDPIECLVSGLTVMSARDQLGIDLNERALGVLDGLLRGEEESGLVERADAATVAKLSLVLPRTRLLAPLFR